MRRIAMLAAALLLLGGCAGAPTQGEPATEADARFQFSAQTIDGDDFDATADLLGQPTVLWFWAPWCTICRAEAPEVTAVAAELQPDVRVLGVAGRGDVADMREFVEQTGTGGLQHLIDADGSIWSGFGVIAQPAYAFIDAEGNVEVFTGSLPPDELRAAAGALTEG